MRIIAGSKRGMKLLPPKTMDTRPITDRVKESLFNVIRNYGMPEDCVVGDLFCGTGSMGLEALSRGARNVTFVELNPKVVTLLDRNIEKAGFVAQSRVVRANAFKTGAAILPGAAKCDLVFVDPPYSLTRETGMTSQLGRLMLILGEQVVEGGIASVRVHERTELLNEYGPLGILDRRTWGTMQIGLYQLNKEATRNEAEADQ